MADVVHMQAKSHAVRGAFRETPRPLCGVVVRSARFARRRADVTCRRCRFAMSSRLPTVNRSRLARRRAQQFAAQSRMCKRLPCCVCTPRDRFWTAVANYLADPERETWPEISDAHHATTRGAGGADRDCTPICRRHHDELDSWACGVETFERRYGVELRAIAAAIHEALSKEKRA